MKPRFAYVVGLAALLAIIGGGVATLTYAPDLAETARRAVFDAMASLSVPARPESPVPTEPRRAVIKHVKAAPPDPPAPREPPPTTISALEALPPLSAFPPANSPPDAAPADETAEDGLDGEVSGEVSLSAVTPLPPPRPANLAALAKPVAPLPPRRPWDLAAMRPTAPAPAAPEPARPDAAEPATPPQPAEAKPQPIETPQQVAEPQPRQAEQSSEPSPTAAEGPQAAPSQAASAAPVTVAAPMPPVRPADLGAIIAAQSRRPDGRGSDGALQQVARLPDAGAPSDEKPEKPAEPQLPPGRFTMGSPVFIRIFKQEGQLELYLRKTNGKLGLYKTYPICKWSGHLGPKLREADYQSPEGFYSVSAKQLHPKSNYHRAFNVGYPNAYDRQNGRTGGLVMVHGSCKSVGCFAMTDAGIEEIYNIVDAALHGGQKEIPVHIFPFRMTEHAIARETGGHWLAFASNGGAQWGDFWRNLKEGYDLFEQTGEPPVAYACGSHYAFGAAGASCQRVAGW